MVNRDKIKIVEFGMDDDAAPSPRSSGGKDIRIIKFDDDKTDDRQQIATAESIGHIKIIEFEDERGRGSAKAATLPKPPRKALPPVKIKEFDKDEDNARRTKGAGFSKIKIMEFD